MQSTILLLVAALAFSGPQTASAQSGGPAVAEHCVVVLINEAEVSAQEAGMLVALDVKEGDRVEEGQTIARINDDLAVSEKLVAEKELAVSRVQAESDVEVQVAYKAAKVAHAEYEWANEANKKAQGAKTAAEMRAKMFTYDKAVLQMEKAQQDRTIAKTTVEARVAQVAQAQINVDRRKIVAPLTGEVVKLEMHPGEWAAPGAPVLRIVQLDRLRVEGFIDPKQLPPSEIDQRAVTFETELAGGRKEKFTGKIDFVNFEIEDNGKIRVKAEVVNRREGSQWLLRPGAAGELTIDVGGPIVSTPRPSAASDTPQVSSVPQR